MSKKVALDLGVGDSENYSKYFEIVHDIDLLEMVDVVLFPGGGDWAPVLYGRPKHPQTSGTPMFDRVQFSIARDAVNMGKYIIGHCRGAQLACILAGGELVQHVQNHHGTHSIVTFDEREIQVNSIHHQMMMPWKVKHEMLAWANTRLSKTYETMKDAFNIEYIEMPLEPECVWFPEVKALATQWHPEWMRNEAEGKKFHFEMVERFIK